MQSVYVYKTLQDFYADANGYLANPNRTVSPVTLSIFQVRYSVQPGQTSPPIQPLDVGYTSGYAQDEWRPRSEPDRDGRHPRRRRPSSAIRGSTTRSPTR